MPESLKQKTIHGIIWSVIERFSAQGIQFLVMIVIARILSPSDYGLIGMLTIFIAVAQSLIDCGFSQALIRKQNRTESDNSTIFFFNIAVSIVIYAILYICAPWVSAFYNEPQLTSLMRVLCLVVIINSFAVVQRAIFTALINFKTQAKASFIAAFFSGIIGVYMAYANWGVWTLVYQQITYAAIQTILLWIYSDWRPCCVLSWKSFIELFSFGSKLMVSGLLDTVYNNLYQLIIGKVFSANSLGYYTKSRELAQFPSSNITSILQRVTYPVLSTMQDDDDRLSANYRKIIRLAAYIMFPMMIGLAAISYPFIDIVLGEKWHDAATLLIPICLSLMWYPVNAINLNLLQVKGRSDLFLRIEVIKKIQGALILIASIPLGVMGMCYGSILSTIISVYINSYYTGKLINVGFSLQMRDLSSSLFISITMGVVMCLVIVVVDSAIMKLTFGISVGIVYFFLVSYYGKIQECFDICVLLRNKKL